MDTYRRHWFQIGVFIFAAIAFAMGAWGHQLNPLSYILTYSFMAVLLHQFEEYACPGGFPSIFNIALQGEKEVPERYPLNAQQVLVTNVFLAYPFYILPILLPNLIWFGIAQVLFGMLQFVIHGIIINRKLGSLYNPGLGTVIFLHIPIGIYYLWYVSAHNLASTTDYILGVILCAVGAVVMIQAPIRLLRDKNTKYPFPESEFYGFARAKLERMRQS